MHIYNTMTRTKEPLTLAGDELRIYLCGPTVYNYIHIGNARTFCVFDTLRRYLSWRKVPLRFVSNITDIDDRIIDGANENGTSTKEYARRYMEEFFKDCAGLGIMPPDASPQATESIDVILDMTATLIDKGYAYVTDDNDVYFRTKKSAGYGRLSRQNLDELEAGAHAGPGERKQDPLDFALWKAAKPGEPSWDSPYGKGRPGWHIECSAMVKRIFGDTVDIHGGGLDLVFPHHENEIAQSECCSGEEFSRYWMHVAMVNVDSRKMSKSLGNFLTVRELSEEYGYEPLRYFNISAHYRSQLNFSHTALSSAAASLERLKNCRRNLSKAIGAAEGSDDGLKETARMRKAQFIETMDDDLNTADALAAIFEFVRDINSVQNQTREALREAAAVFDELTRVLGILLEGDEEEIPEEIMTLVRERVKARADRDFKKADEIRDSIASLGYALEDSKDGPVVKRK